MYLAHAPSLQGLDAWERRWWRKGTSVAGVDEAGRGPLAGPAGDPSSTVQPASGKPPSLRAHNLVF